MFGFIITLMCFVLVILVASFFLPKEVTEAQTRYERENNYPAKVLYRPRSWARFGAGGLLLIAAIITAFASFYTQSPGEAKVVVNWDGSVAGVDTTPGFSWKAPWQKVTDWDLLAQKLTYAGGDTAPSYTGGDIQGREVTVSLERGIQANIDVIGSYSLTRDGEILTRLYSSYRSQESFTQQIIQPAILSTLREAPGALAPAEFRAQRGVVADGVIQALNDYFAEHNYGVTIQSLEIQDIRFSEDVESSLRAVEVAQQAEAEAEANLRATEINAQAQVVEAEAAAKAAIAQAEGQAEANRLLSESLTPEILQQRMIEAYKAGTVFVVPDGSTPFIQP